MPVPKCVPKKKRKAYEKEHRKVEKAVRGKVKTSGKPEVKNSWAVATKVAEKKYCKKKKKR